MNIYVRKRGNSPAGALFMTFVLGLAIGFSLAYAVFGGREKAPAAEPAVREPIPVAAGSPPPPLTPDATAMPPAVPPPAEAPLPPEELAAPQPAVTLKEVLVSGEELWPGRFLFIAVEGMTLDDNMKSLLKEIRPGGVVLRQRNLADARQTAELVGQIKMAAGMADGIFNLPLIAVEQEGGSRNLLAVEKAPPPADLGRADDPKAAREIGRSYGAAAVSRRIGVILAPVLNVADTKAAEQEPTMVAGDRCFGTDQGLVADIGLAFAKGVQDAWALPVAKYYPGLGKPRKLEGKETYVLEGDARKLGELMYPFSEAAVEDMPGILVGHVVVPELDPKNVKRPASISLALVKLILRDKFHYAGVILADDVSADSMTAFQPPERAAVEALAAGCDAVLLLDSQQDRVRAVCAAMQDAIDKGKLARDQLTESRKRLDAWQVRLARLDVKEAPPETTPVTQTPLPAETAAPKEPVPEPTPEAAAPKEPVAAPTPEAAAPKELVPESAPEAAAPKEPVAAPTPEAAEVTPSPVAEVKAGVTEEGPVAPTREIETAIHAEQQPAPTEKPVEAAPAPPEQPPNTEKIIHEIKKGESLSKIAAKYGVKKEDIMAWNAMKDSVVKYGFKLIVYRPIAQPAAEAKPVSEPAPPPVEQKEPEPSPAVEPKVEIIPPTPAPQPPNTVKREHVVAAGETLADIAGKYQVQVDDLKAWNGLTGETVTPGQVLNVYVPPSPEPEKSAETTTHTVAKGENIYKIAAQYKTTVKKLIEINKLETPDRLLIGQKLVVPKAPSIP